MGVRENVRGVTIPKSQPGWGVYVLRCADGTLYTGCTNDLAQRLSRHGRGKGAAYTRSRLPVRLVFWEPAADRGAALRREWALKKLRRAAKLRLLRAAPFLRRVRRSARGAAR
jgi:putative endonuclease